MDPVFLSKSTVSAIVKHFLSFLAFILNLYPNVGLKTPLQEDLSEPELYGDLVPIRKIVGKTDFRNN